MKAHKKVLKDIKTLTIKRSKWLRGKGEQASSLLNSRSGKMCCLGQYAESCGIKPDQMKNLASPAELLNYLGGSEFVENVNGTLVKTKPQNIEWKTKLVMGKPTCYDNTVIASVMMSTNDDDDGEFTEEAREQKLTRLFKRIGVKVKFVD